MSQEAEIIPAPSFLHSKNVWYLRKAELDQEQPPLQHILPTVTFMTTPMKDNVRVHNVRTSAPRDLLTVVLVFSVGKGNSGRMYAWVTQLVSFNCSPASIEKHTRHKRATRPRTSKVALSRQSWSRERGPSAQWLAYSLSCEHYLCKIALLFKLKAFEIFLRCLKFKIPRWVAFIDRDGPHGTMKKKNSHFIGNECSFAFSGRTCSRAWTLLFCHLFIRQCHTA